VAKKKKPPKWYEERQKAIEEAREITRRVSEQYYAARAAREHVEPPADG
jgi:hypothetical protein